MHGEQLFRENKGKRNDFTLEREQKFRKGSVCTGLSVERAHTRVSGEEGARKLHREQPQRFVLCSTRTSLCESLHKRILMIQLIDRVSNFQRLDSCAVILLSR